MNKVQEQITSFIYFSFREFLLAVQLHEHHSCSFSGPSLPPCTTGASFLTTDFLNEVFSLYQARLTEGIYGICEMRSQNYCYPFFTRIGQILLDRQTVVQEKFFLECLTFEDGTDPLSQKVGNQLPI
jgi:hypothetical protein